ncbi:MAG TPA: hypothetical protein PKM65_13775 [Spirochaetota bacterium]|nr:hypothetical protein [Spirochaetota bacterium]HNT11135.1 hypothetical protein [Spirochaetota bacterium]
MKGPLAPSTAISFPLTISAWRRTAGTIALGAFVALSVYLFAKISDLGIVLFLFKFGLLVAVPLIFVFYEIGVHSYVFSAEGVVIRFIYGRKKTILPENIVRMALDDEYRTDLVVNWKKSRRHATRTIRISGKLCAPYGFSATGLLDALTRLYGGAAAPDRSVS